MRIFNFQDELFTIRNTLGISKFDFQKGIYIPSQRYAIDIQNAIYEDGSSIFNTDGTLRVLYLNIESEYGDILIDKNEINKISKKPYYPIAPALLLEECFNIKQYFTSSQKDLLMRNPLSDIYGPLIHAKILDNSLENNICYAIESFYPNFNQQILNFIYHILKRVKLDSDSVYEFDYSGLYFTIRNKGDAKSLRFDELLYERRLTK